jgi:hypothetical protein
MQHRIHMRQDEDNPVTHATLGTHETGRRHSRDMQHWVHMRQDQDNPETYATLGTHETGRRQSRDTCNMGYT